MVSTSQTHLVVLKSAERTDLVDCEPVNGAEDRLKAQHLPAMFEQTLARSLSIGESHRLEQCKMESGSAQCTGNALRASEAGKVRMRSPVPLSNPCGEESRRCEPQKRSSAALVRQRWARAVDGARRKSVDLCMP